MIDITTDITIIRGRPAHGKATISAQSSAGIQWVLQNLDTRNSLKIVVIDAEHVDEFEEMMKLRDLTVTIL